MGHEGIFVGKRTRCRCNASGMQRSDQRAGDMRRRNNLNAVCAWRGRGLWLRHYSAAIWAKNVIASDERSEITAWDQEYARLRLDVRGSS
jgi:hypothetical protein